MSHSRRGGHPNPVGDPAGRVWDPTDRQHRDQTSLPDQPLHVVLPLLTLVPGGMGGSETYVRELTRELSTHPDVRLTAAVAEPGCAWLPDENVAVAGGLRAGESARDRIISQTRAEFSSAAHRLVRRADVVHYPLTVPTPRTGRRTPVVQSLLDTQHHDLRNNFSRAERLYRTVRYDAPARRADAVITISEFCKQRISHNLGVPMSRIHVAHLGVDAGTFQANLGPRGEFVLYPARSWPHKNHHRLIQAVGLLRLTHPRMRLVLTGGGLNDLGPLPDWVDDLGLVSREELLKLYQRASCLAFPSLYEGFGLPPLEAMASGCPVAASSSGSLPEICGDAAVTFDAESPPDIARGLHEAITHADVLAPRGLQRARQFTWRRCADEHVKVYRHVLGARLGIPPRGRSQRT